MSSINKERMERLYVTSEFGDCKSGIVSVEWLSATMTRVLAEGRHVAGGSGSQATVWKGGNVTAEKNKHFARDWHLLMTPF